MPTDPALPLLRSAALPFKSLDDLTPLLDAMAPSQLVLLGEASHGTHDFYALRAQLTARLIARHGFNAVIVEADWPDAYRVHRHVLGSPADTSAADALIGFSRFPQWMWRNFDVVYFVDWLRRHNATAPKHARAGFYGMDLYSLFSSMEAVVAYLDHTDPQSARKARDRYACFDPYADDPQSYGHAAALDLDLSCQSAVTAQLRDMQRHSTHILNHDGHVDADEAFFAEQNARLAQNAEEYYREMFTGHKDTWNLRDTHMADSIEQLMTHFRRHNKTLKAVVWAHNSHLGDARATASAQRGELNVGQLCRERWGDKAGGVFNLGFTTHTGTVAAATHWGDPVQIKQVRPSLDGSIENLFHQLHLPQCALLFKNNPALTNALATERLQRAIGVIYRPNTERQSHYFHARISHQFNAVIHIDHTTAVTPLEPAAPFTPEKAETYPTGI